MNSAEGFHPTEGRFEKIQGPYGDMIRGWVTDPRFEEIASASVAQVIKNPDFHADFFAVNPKTVSLIVTAIRDSGVVRFPRASSTKGAGRPHAVFSSDHVLAAGLVCVEYERLRKAGVKGTQAKLLGQTYDNLRSVLQQDVLAYMLPDGFTTSTSLQNITNFSVVTRQEPQVIWGAETITQVPESKRENNSLNISAITEKAAKIDSMHGLDSYIPGVHSGFTAAELEVLYEAYRNFFPRKSSDADLEERNEFFDTLTNRGVLTLVQGVLGIMRKSKEEITLGILYQISKKVREDLRTGKLKITTK